MSRVITWIISGLSLVVAIIAICVSIWTHKRSHKLQARIVALEEAREKDRLAEKQKANLTAHITKEEISRTRTSRIYTKYYLVIENKGLSEARNVELLLAGKPVLEHSAIQNSQKDEIRHIGAQSSIKYEFSNGFMRELPLKTEITWEDDSGEPGKYSTTLTL